MSEPSVIKQAGVIAHRIHKGALEIVLVTSLDSQRWVLPKGHVDPGMSANQAALIEAYEEAGVEGSISDEPFGIYDYTKSEQKNGDFCRVKVFPMKVKTVLNEWPESNLRERTWMSFAQASKRVEEKDLKKLLIKFHQEIS